MRCSLATVMHITTRSREPCGRWVRPEQVAIGGDTPGFTITPEINYTKFDGARKDKAFLNGGSDVAFGGIIRFQRDF